MRTERQIQAFRAAMLASLGLVVACGGESRSAGTPSGGAGGVGGATGGTGDVTGGAGPTRGGEAGDASGGTGGAVGGSAGAEGGTGGATGGTAGTDGGSRGASGGSAGVAGNAQGGGQPFAGAGGAPQGGTTGSLLDCEPSTPVLDEEGNDTGTATCDNGVVHRVAPVACRSDLPRNVEYPSDPGSECASDADCAAAPHGYCDPEPTLPPSGRLVCFYGCIADSDCSPGFVCECGADIGRCVAATCASDAECGDGLCVRTDDPGMCLDGLLPTSRFACSTSADACYLGTDCATNRCGYESGARVCLPQGLCGIGRPFLVDGAARTAAAMERGDFSARLQPFVELDGATRTVLARHWERCALLEHASVASFARFSLELLALGAPSELVAAAAAAMSDETRHAELCFGLAGCYEGRPLGPGPLSMAGVAPESELARLVEAVVLEGCIGETAAALEASIVASTAKDPVVRSVLERIASDEQRHAELAFRFLRWVVGEHPELAPVARAVLLREQRALAACAQPEAEEDLWLSLGVCPESLARTLRTRVLTEVVAPCLAGVIEIQAHATPDAGPRAPRHARGGMLEIS